MSRLPLTVTPFQDSKVNSTNISPSTLSATHYLVAHKLVQGRSKASIARSLQISPYTINMMLKDTEFVLLVDHIKEETKAKSILSSSEIQRRLDEDVITSLETIQDIRDGDFTDAPVASVRLKAATLLLDKASNMPKAVKDDNSATINIFSPHFIQTLIETAKQVGDDSVLESANLALNTLPVIDIIDETEYSATVVAAPILNVPEVKVRTLDELLTDIVIEEDNNE